jgi:hypothetical protein
MIINAAFLRAGRDSRPFFFFFSLLCVTQFFDCVERLNFEWLSIGRAFLSLLPFFPFHASSNHERWRSCLRRAGALNQNPYECRQMYLSYAEGASPQPPDGIVDSLDQLAASHDPLFGLYDAGTRTRTRTHAPPHTHTHHRTRSD